MTKFTVFSFEEIELLVRVDLIRTLRVVVIFALGTRSSVLILFRSDVGQKFGLVDVVVAEDGSVADVVS